MLTPLQRRLVQLVADLPEAEDFALAGGAEARDFVDVAALLEVYSSEQLIELASEKDAGFSLDRFRESLAAIHRLDAAELETTGANSGEIVALFDTWQERLTVVDGDE